MTSRGLGPGAGLGGSALAARLGWAPTITDTWEEGEAWTGMAEVEASSGLEREEGRDQRALREEEEEQQELEARRRRRRARRRQQQGGAARQTKKPRPKKDEVEGPGQERGQGQDEERDRDTDRDLQKSRSQRSGSRNKRRRSRRHGSDGGGYDSVTSCEFPTASCLKPLAAP